MIDVGSRTQLAETIRHFACGLISNKEYWNIFSSNSSDVAIMEIHWGTIEYYVGFNGDKDEEFYLKDELRLSSEIKSVFARTILFLKTEQEYEWRSFGSWSHLATEWGLAVVTFGKSATISNVLRRRQGDIDVWPFISQKQYEEALRFPPYLRGPKFGREQNTGD